VNDPSGRKASRTEVVRVDTLTSIKALRQVIESGTFVAAAERMDLSTRPNGNIEVPVHVVSRYRSWGGVAHAVAAGIGLAALPQIFFEDPPFKDVLMPILTDYPPQERTLYVVYVSRRYLPLKIRAFIDFVMERFPRSRAKLATVH